jgi:hypothetical protein
VDRLVFEKETIMILRMRGLLSGALGLALCAVLMAGCEDKVTETQVRDKPLGGTEVKQKTVTQDGDKVKVEEKKTDIDRHGNVTEEKKKTTESEKD